jgi:hypothetical protein
VRAGGGVLDEFEPHPREERVAHVAWAKASIAEQGGSALSFGILGAPMVLRRNRRRMKVGQNVYWNIGKDGRVVSTTTKSGKSTFTSGFKGKRYTYNHGNGFSSTNYTSHKQPKTKLPKIRKFAKIRPKRSSNGDGSLGFFTTAVVIVLLTLFFYR